MRIPSNFIPNKNSKLIKKLSEKRERTQSKKGTEGLLFLLNFVHYIHYWEDGDNPRIIRHITLKDSPGRSKPTVLTFTEDDIYYVIDRNVYSAVEEKKKYDFDHDVLALKNHKGTIYAGTLAGCIYRLGEGSSKTEIQKIKGAVSEFCILEDKLCYLVHKAKTEVRDVFTDNLILDFKPRVNKIVSIDSDVFYVGIGDHACGVIHNLSEGLPIKGRYQIINGLYAFEDNLMYCGWWGTDIVQVEPDVGTEVGEIPIKSVHQGNTFVNYAVAVPKEVIFRYFRKLYNHQK